MQKAPPKECFDKIFLNIFTNRENCGIMTLLHKLNIRISGIFYLYGDIIPFFRHNHFLNLVKAQAPLNGYGNTLILFSLCSNNRSLRFSVRQLRLAHFLI